MRIVLTDVYRKKGCSLDRSEVGSRMVKFLETKEEFDTALKNAGSKLVVVDFTASWCGPCQRIAPKFQEMSEEFKEALFFKVDVDNNDVVAEQENIQAMPTFVFYRNGSRIAELTGANEAKLRSLLQEHAK